MTNTTKKIVIATSSVLTAAAVSGLSYLVGFKRGYRARAEETPEQLAPNKRTDDRPQQRAS